MNFQLFLPYAGLIYNRHSYSCMLLLTVATYPMILHSRFSVKYWLRGSDTHNSHLVIDIVLYGEW